MSIGGRDVRLNERARANSVLCVKKKKNLLKYKETNRWRRGMERGIYTMLKPTESQNGAANTE